MNKGKKSWQESDKIIEFVKNNLSEEIRKNLFAKLDKQLSEYEASENKDKFEDDFYFKSI